MQIIFCPSLGHEFYMTPSTWSDFGHSMPPPLLPPTFSQFKFVFKLDCSFCVGIMRTFFYMLKYGMLDEWIMQFKLGFIYDEFEAASKKCKIRKYQWDGYIQ